jgi:6-phosphofructokinase 1
MNEGGSIIGTSREPDLAKMTPVARGQALTRLVQRAADAEIDILYVIGGDGGMRAAVAMSNTAKALAEDSAPSAMTERLRNLVVVGIPKTMDNDILWVWFSFGFQSAVERSTEFVRQLATEATANPRLCVIQLFGSDSGFVAADAATAASGKCDLFLIPEVPFAMAKITDYLSEKFVNPIRPHAVVVMAETAVPTDLEMYLDGKCEDLDLRLRKAELEALRDYVKNGRLLKGPTPDDLRSGALKVVSRVLEWRLKKQFPRLRMFANEPRQLIRAIPPSSSDITHARRLGYLAVDGAIAGYRDFMVSQWLTEYVMVPLNLVVLGRKRIPDSGAFLANARASTGQPAALE